MAVNKKALWISIASVFGLAGGYLLYQYFKQKKSANYGVLQQVPNPPAPIVTNGGVTVPNSSIDNNFPLKKGSNNDYVKKLQMALGVVVDGIFGSKTLAALQAQTGKSSISNYDDLTATIAAINQNNQQITNSPSFAAAANNILNAYNTNGFSNLYALNDTTWKQYGYDSASDSYISTGFIINWAKGQTMNTNDYIPSFVTQDGYLMIYCNKGVNVGYFKANPLDIYYK